MRIGTFLRYSKTILTFLFTMTCQCFVFWINVTTLVSNTEGLTATNLLSGGPKMVIRVAIEFKFFYQVYLFLYVLYGLYMYIVEP